MQARQTVGRPTQTYVLPSRPLDRYYDPILSQHMTRQDADVSGVYRYKFFRRPFVPYLTAVTPDAVLAPAQQKVFQAPTEVARPPTPPFREMAVQTDYRESEAQTDPYTPDYVIPSGKPEPDILALLPFTWGNGLPAGAHEVYLIEKAQARREAEAALPPVVDGETFNQRVQFFAQCQLEDWMEREEEIKRLQEQRVAVLREALTQRDGSMETALVERLETIRQLKFSARDATVQKIQQRRVKDSASPCQRSAWLVVGVVWSNSAVSRKIQQCRVEEDPAKALRKLAEARKAPQTGTHVSRDVINEYYNYGSKVYAPLPRDGQLPDRGADQFQVRTSFLDTLEAVLSFEQPGGTAPSALLQVRVPEPHCMNFLRLPPTPSPPPAGIEMLHRSIPASLFNPSTKRPGPPVLRTQTSRIVCVSCLTP
ncbi:putative amy-1-associating protein expressed in testis 1 [Paratrimastix pyriformis]|uniref:Cilia- and flagella-associated protein 91 n=1 Tax=Paratrimastix pyriformis TaxID=342808 RepID=A0ABQ8U2Y4_9EUKA|nr:putative amy-1-associating protein expressed in testis 1 [Paratrimastix pyriformis]